MQPNKQHTQTPVPWKGLTLWSWDLNGCPLLCMFLANNLSGRSVFSASVCTSTVVYFRHQNVKEIIAMGRLGRKLSHILENISKGKSWKETEKERLDIDRRDWGICPMTVICRWIIIDGFSTAFISAQHSPTSTIQSTCF